MGAGDTLKMGLCTRGAILWPGKTNSWSKDNEAGMISSEKEYERVVGSSLPLPFLPTPFILLDTGVAGLSLSNFFVAWKSSHLHSWEKDIMEPLHKACPSEWHCHCCWALPLARENDTVVKDPYSIFSEHVDTLKKNWMCSFSIIPIQLVILSLI